MTCIGRVIVCWNRQGVGLHSVKHIENGQRGKEINIRQHREMHYTGVGLNRVYCTCIVNWDLICYFIYIHAHTCIHVHSITMKQMAASWSYWISFLVRDCFYFCIKCVDCSLEHIHVLYCTYIDCMLSCTKLIRYRQLWLGPKHGNCC